MCNDTESDWEKIVQNSINIPHEYKLEVINNNDRNFKRNWNNATLKIDYRFFFSLSDIITDSEGECNL